MTTAGTAAALARRRRARSPRSTPAGRSARPPSTSSTPVLGGRGGTCGSTTGSSTCSTRTTASPTAALAFRDRHDELLSLYRLRLQHALEGVYAVQRRTRGGRARPRRERPRTRPSTTPSRWCGTSTAGTPRSSTQLYARARRRPSPIEASERDRLAPWRDRRAPRRVRGASWSTGGHVGTLLRALRLFAIRIPDELPGGRLVGRRDGADRAGRAVPRPRTRGRHRGRGVRPRARPGAGRRGAAARPAPAAARRPRPVRRCMARRFTDQHCLLLDDGTARRAHARTAGCPRGARILGIDGAVHELADGRGAVTGAPGHDAEPAPRGWPSTGCASGCPSTVPPSTASSSATASPDRRGRAGHLPVPRRRRRGAGAAPRRRACPTRCRMRGCRTPTSGPRRPSCPRGRGSSTSSRPAAASTTSGSTTRSTRGWRTRPIGSSSVCAATGYEVPDWVLPRPRGPAGRARRGRAALQGAASRPAGPGSTCRPATTPRCATRCSSSTTAPTTSTTRR